MGRADAAAAAGGFLGRPANKRGCVENVIMGRLSARIAMNSFRNLG